VGGAKYGYNIAVDRRRTKREVLTTLRTRFAHSIAEILRTFCSSGKTPTAVALKMAVEND
jgi:Mg-chelatase subunit ChlD